MTTRSRRVGWSAGICAAVVSAATFLAADQSPVAPQSQVPIFKGRLDVVRTEVDVIDNRTGAPVPGLTQKDFSVFENGVRQEIASFAESDQKTLAPGEGDRPGPAGGAAERRVFLLIFNSSPIMRGPVKPHEGAIAFLREKLRPSDLAAVMVWNRVTPLTADRARLAEVIAHVENIPENVFVLVRRDAQFPRDFGVDTQAAIDAWLSPLDATDGFLRSAATPLLGTNVFRNHGSVPWNRRLSGSDLLKVYAGIEYLRHVQGEKHLVLLSTWGLSPPFRMIDPGAFHAGEEDDRRLAAYANDAGVALNIIHTIGTTAAHFSTMSGQEVARESGGLFASVRTAEQQLARIDAATRSGYVIGYAPANPTMDGKYRKVEIKVDRKDVTVVYRRGYTARPDPPPVDPSELMARLRMGEAAGTNTRFDDIDVGAKATAAGSGSARQVRADVNINAAKLSLTQAEGKWTGQIDLMLLAFDRQDKVVGVVNQRMTLGMSQALYEQARTTGIPYTGTIPVRAVAERLKVIVYNYDSDRLGVTSVPVR
jgi:VWFA-related protein